MDNYPREYMTAEESHYCGEPCWHVCQYYEKSRNARRLDAARYRRISKGVL